MQRDKRKKKIDFERLIKTPNRKILMEEEEEEEKVKVTFEKLETEPTAS